MANTVSTIATEIYEELGSPSDTSIPVIASWLRNNLGKINILIDTEYVVNESDLEINPAIEDKEKDIYKEIYFIKYYDRMIAQALRGASSQNLQSISDESSSVKWTNKSEIARQYMQMKSQSEKNLTSLIDAYLRGFCNPIGVIGDDIADPNYAGSSDIDYYLSYGNRTRNLY